MLDETVYDTANKQQDEVAAETGDLVKRVIARKKGKSPPEVRSELLRLFDRSPLGVMRALELHSLEGTTDELIAKDELALELPAEFQRFRRQTPAERAAEAA